MSAEDHLGRQFDDIIKNNVPLEEELQMENSARDAEGRPRVGKGDVNRRTIDGPAGIRPLRRKRPEGVTDENEFAALDEYNRLQAEKKKQYKLSDGVGPTQENGQPHKKMSTLHGNANESILKWPNRRFNYTYLP
jgi:hypothetical protein